MHQMSSWKPAARKTRDMNKRHWKRTEVPPTLWDSIGSAAAQRLGRKKWVEETEKTKRQEHPVFRSNAHQTAWCLEVIGLCFNFNYSVTGAGLSRKTMQAKQLKIWRRKIREQHFGWYPNCTSLKKKKASIMAVRRQYLYYSVLPK